MNSRENFLAMMEGRNACWLPFDLPVTQPIAEAILRDTGQSAQDAFDSDFRSMGVQFLNDDPSEWQKALEKLGFCYPAETVTGPFGLAWKRPPLASLGCATHLLEMLHPLEVIEDVGQLEKLPWPDPADPAHYRHLPEHCRQLHQLGKVAAGSCECTIFEHTWYLRGMDNVFCDWADENPVSDWLLDYFTERSIQICQAFVKSGADLVRLGDDVGTQTSLLISPEQWRRHLKPRLKRVIDAIREASGNRKVFVQYHSDGAITPLIEEFIEVGIDILNPMQPECMEIEAVAAEYRGKIAFCGMIGTQTTMPFGTEQDVRDAVGKVRNLSKEGARVIVAPTHVLEPDVPLSNIRAFVEAAKQPL